MIFVQKKIVELVNDQKWRIEVSHTLRYGKSGAAPMVTWIIDFRWDQNAAKKPLELYFKNVEATIAAPGHVRGDGQIVLD